MIKFVCVLTISNQHSSGRSFSMRTGKTRVCDEKAAAGGMSLNDVEGSHGREVTPAVVVVVPRGYRGSCGNHDTPPPSPSRRRLLGSLSPTVARFCCVCRCRRALCVVNEFRVSVLI